MNKDINRELDKLERERQRLERENAKKEKARLKQEGQKKKVERTPKEGNTPTPKTKTGGLKTTQANYDQAVTRFMNKKYKEAKTLFEEIRKSGVDLGWRKNRELRRYLTKIDAILTGEQSK